LPPQPHPHSLPDALPISRARAVARPAAIPARIALAGVVAISFAIRFAAALIHTTPLYFPDEYIYASIARSLGTTGKPLIRGHSRSEEHTSELQSRVDLVC